MFALFHLILCGHRQRAVAPVGLFWLKSLASLGLDSCDFPMPVARYSVRSCDLSHTMVAEMLLAHWVLFWKRRCLLVEVIWMVSGGRLKSVGTWTRNLIEYPLNCVEKNNIGKQIPDIKSETGFAFLDKNTSCGRQHHVANMKSAITKFI